MRTKSTVKLLLEPIVGHSQEEIKEMKERITESYDQYGSEEFCKLTNHLLFKLFQDPNIHLKLSNLMSLNRFEECKSLLQENDDLDVTYNNHEYFYFAIR